MKHRASLTVLFTNLPFASAPSIVPHEASIKHLVSVRLCDYEQKELVPLRTRDREAEDYISFSLPDFQQCASFPRNIESYAQA